MCGSMVDIQSAPAENRRGKEERNKKKKREETTGWKYNGLPIPYCGHNNSLECQIAPTQWLLSHGRGAKYWSIAMSVSVCLSVCPLAYLKNHTCKLHEIFCTRYMWPWLGPSLTILQYTLYTSGFVDDVTFSHNGKNTDTGLESFDVANYSSRLARYRRGRGRSLLSSIALLNIIFWRLVNFSVIKLQYTVVTWHPV